MLKRAHSRRTRRLALPPRAPRAPPASPARPALCLPVPRASRSARESRPRMPRKRGHRDRAALGEPLETAKDPSVSRETSVLKHQIVSRETFERIRVPRGEEGSEPDRVARAGSAGSAHPWCGGGAGAVLHGRERDATSCGFYTVRERRDALRLRCGRERGATSCGFGAGAPLCAGQLRGKRATCAGRSCERDALRCGCAEPAFTPPGTPGARASDGPLRRSPARRARTACRRRAPCCPR